MTEKEFMECVPEIKKHLFDEDAFQKTKNLLIKKGVSPTNMEELKKSIEIVNGLIDGLLARHVN